MMTWRRFGKVTLMVMLLVGLVGVFPASAYNFNVSLGMDLTNRWPVDASGNMTLNQSQIAGFCMDANLTYQTAAIGQLHVCTHLNEAFSPLNVFTTMSLSGTLTVTGLGTCQMDGQAITLNRGSPGTFELKFVSKLHECSGGLSGFLGLIDGVGTDDLNDVTLSHDNYTINIFLTEGVE